MALIGEFLVGLRDSIRLDTYRVVTGISMIGYVATWWFDDAAEWLTREGFHLSPQAAGQEWLVLPPLPTWALAPFGVCLFGAMLAFTIGLRLRVAAPVAFLALVYVTHVDPLAAFTPHDLLIVALALFSVSQPGSYWTLDAVPSRPVSVWPVRVLQATLLLSYPIAGLCKITSEAWVWNSFALREDVNGPYRNELAAFLLRNLPDAGWVLLQSLALAFELVAPLLFGVRRLRTVGFVWGAGMHLGIGALMDEFGWFALQMVAFYALFADDASLHALRQRLARLGGRRVIEAGATEG
jgi:hypothetical protein